MDIVAYNRGAWDFQVARGNPWTLPVSREAIAAAVRDEWSVVLTPQRPVPRSWFPPLKDAKTLCLAGAGGQQAPILAAAGARVTVFDNSPRQLAQDRMVADRDGLAIATIEGDMRDLSAIADQTFRLVFHPCSNCFVPDVRPIWAEVFRVLEPGGILLAGFVNPAAYIFDDASIERGELRVRHRLPYSDEKSLSESEREALIRANEPFVFSHSLDDLLGGQTDAGLLISGLYEDTWPNRIISEHLPTFIATRALRPM